MGGGGGDIGGRQSSCCIIAADDQNQTARDRNVTRQTVFYVFNVLIYCYVLLGYDHAWVGTYEKSRHARARRVVVAVVVVRRPQVISEAACRGHDAPTYSPCLYTCVRL